MWTTEPVDPVVMDIKNRPRSVADVDKTEAGGYNKQQKGAVTGSQPTLQINRNR